MSKLLGALAVLLIFVFIAGFAFFAFTPANIEQEKIIVDVSLENSGGN